MKKILASAVVALLPTAALANEGNSVDGFVSVAAGYNSVDQGDYSYSSTYGSGSGTSTAKTDGLDLEGRASASLPITGALAAQVDGVFSRTYSKPNNCGSCRTLHTDDLSLAAHVFVRSPDKGMIGAFFQRSTEHRNFGPGQTMLFGGGEAALYMGRVSVSGQMGYATLDTDYFNGKTDGPFATLKMRYFPSDDLMVEIHGEHGQLRQKPGASMGYDCPDYCSTNKFTLWDIGGKAEYRLHNSRFSLFAQVDYRDQDSRNNYVYYTSYYSMNEQQSSNLRAMAGIKVNFGATSLFDRDRSGAALDPVRTPSQNMYNFEA